MRKLVSGTLKLVVSDDWAAVALSSASRISPIVICLLVMVPDLSYFGEVCFGEICFIRFVVVYLNDLGMNPLGKESRLSL